MIERLHIVQLGKIKQTDFHFDLLNVIYGVNESGKSSLIEGLKVAYYGFPVKKAERYKYGSSTIHFEWKAKDGTEYLIERSLAENKQTARIVGQRRGEGALWGTDNNKKQNTKLGIDPQILPHPIQRELFELLFCIDENRLNLFRKDEWNYASTVLLDSVSGGVVNDIEAIRESIEEEFKTRYSTRSNSKSVLNSYLTEWKTVETALQNQLEKEVEHRRIEAECAELEKTLSAHVREYASLRQKLDEKKKKLPDYLRTVQYQRMKDELIDPWEDDEILLISGCKEYLRKKDEIKHAMDRTKNEREELSSLHEVKDKMVEAKKQLPIARKRYMEYLRLEAEKRVMLDEKSRLENALNALPNIHFDARLDEAEAIAKQYQRNHRGWMEWMLVLLSVGLVISGLIFRVDLLNLFAIFASILSMLLFFLRGGNRRQMAQRFARAMNDPSMGSLVSSADALFFERAKAASANRRRLRYISEQNLTLEEDPYIVYGGFDSYCEQCESEYDKWLDNQRQMQRRERIDVRLSDLDGSLRELELEYAPLIRRALSFGEQRGKEFQEGLCDCNLFLDEMLDAKIHQALHNLEANLRIKERLAELSREGIVDFDLTDGESYSSQAMEKMEQQCLEYSDSIVECKEILADRRAVLAHVSYDTTLEGRKRYLEEKITELKVNSKRLRFFEILLEDAVRVYREEHQPLFAQKISEYLSTIVGKEMKVLVDTSEGFRYELICEGEVIPYLGALSTGFIQQLALCARLALMDVVDPMRELPIILDDSFAFWDDTRRQNAFVLLTNLGRVIYYATCSAQRVPNDWNRINMLL